MEQEQRTVFVTGATGFIGRRVVFRLLARGHRVTALVRRPENATSLQALGVRLVRGDVTRPDGLDDAMRGHDWLVHLANRYTLDEADPGVYEDVNVRGNEGVMRAALRAGVRKVVHVSSGVSYGASPDQPLVEESRPGPHPVPYWRSKHAGDAVVWRLHREAGLPVVVVYPGGVLGAGDPNATGRWVRDILAGLPVRAFEDAGFTYVHVDDVAEAIVRAAAKDGNVGERYLVGREFVTHAEFTRLVSEVAGVRRPPLVLPRPVAFASAALLTGVARLTGRAPLWNFSLNTARTLATGFRFGSDKAERDLGLAYRPVRRAIAECVAAARR